MKFHGKKRIGENFAGMNKWTKVPVSPVPKGIDGWVAHISETWAYKGQMNFIVQVRNFSCRLGEMNHVIIKKIEMKKVLTGNMFDSLEPNYQDKLRIKQVLKARDRDAIEIMPSEKKLVDAANLYHLWILPANHEFPYKIKYSDKFEHQKSGREYEIEYGIQELDTTYGRIKTISIKSKDNKPLSWRQKQAIKNDLHGSNKIAIEVIPKNTTYMNNVCYLICLPEEVRLPFGLHDEEYRF